MKHNIYLVQTALFKNARILSRNSNIIIQSDISKTQNIGHCPWNWQVNIMIRYSPFKVEIAIVISLSRYIKYKRRRQKCIIKNFKRHHVITWTRQQKSFTTKNLHFLRAIDLKNKRHNKTKSIQDKTKKILQPLPKKVYLWYTKKLLF